MEMEQRKKMAVDAHHEGYNCAQAVLIAYLDIFSDSQETILKMAYGLGTGVSMRHELCGVVNGGALALGLKYGKKDADVPLKKDLYALTREFIQEFEDIYGSLRCGELLGLWKNDKATVKDTCDHKIEVGVELLEKYLLKDAL